jgi:hypothetical protein
LKGDNFVTAKKSSKESSASEAVPTSQMSGSAQVVPSNNGPGESLAKIPQGGLVRALVTPEQAKLEWENYLSLCRAVLDESDFMYYVHYRNKQGDEEKPVAFALKSEAEKKADFLRKNNQTSIVIRERKKRSAWDKLARFFGLTVLSPGGPQVNISLQQVGNFIVESRVGESFSLIVWSKADTLEIVKATALVSVSAPGCRTAIGDGACSVSERRRGADGFAHADHDIPTTAMTRAMNRAISRCIGTGETSAEEMGIDPTPVEQVSQSVEIATPSPVVPSAAPGPAVTISSTTKGPLMVPGGASTTSTAAPAPSETPSALKEAVKKFEKAGLVKPGTQATVPSPPQAARSQGTEAKAAAPKEAARPKASAPANSAPKFVPLPTGSEFQDRLRHLETWAYGQAVRDSKRENQLVKYALFLVPEATNVDIESQGRWDGTKWKGEMLKLVPEERRSRLGLLEDMAASSTPAEFLTSLKAGVEEIWK